MKFVKYVLETAVFVCGAVVMVYELVGSRVLGPYFGTSIYVWTSLIGVILGSLSLGYYFGGRLADKKPQIEILALVIFLAAMLIGLMTLVKDPLLALWQGSGADLKTGSVFASIAMFMPASILLGMVSPYAAKIKISDIAKSGSVVGNLSAISTAGSITGTFLSGFYLIPYFGTNKLLLLLTIVLIAISISLAASHYFRLKVISLAVALLCIGIASAINLLLVQEGFIDVDTAYSRVWIYDRVDGKINQTVRKMGINNENHSSMFLNSDELVNEYTKYYHLAAHFNPGFKKTVMFGGAGYSFPKNFLHKYPSSTIDVIEIDPGVTELARKYFNLKDNPRLTIHHQDGRVYLNTTKDKFDVIFGDAFGSHYSLPYQLTTREAVQKNYDILNDHGVAVINVISSIEGMGGMFLRSEYATYKQVFPQVLVIPVNRPNDGWAVQNIMLVAIKSSDKISLQDADPILNEYLHHAWKHKIDEDTPVLTDDFAPVDYYISKAI